MPRITIDEESERANQWVNLLVDNAALLSFNYYGNYAPEQWDRIGPGLLAGFLNVPEVDESTPAMEGSYREIDRPGETVADPISANPWSTHDSERYIDDGLRNPLFADVYCSVQRIAEEDESYVPAIPGLYEELERVVDDDALVIWEPLYKELEQFAASPLDGGLAINPDGEISDTTKAYNTPPAAIKEHAETREDWGMRFHAAAQNAARPEVMSMLAWSEEEGGGSLMYDGEEVYSITLEEIGDELTEKPVLLVDDVNREIKVYHGERYEETVEQPRDTATVEHAELTEEERIDINDIVGEFTFDDE